MKVHRSGYYQWLNKPIFKIEQENIVILSEIKKSYKESNGVYGYRNVHKDLVELGFKVNKKRVARLMRESGLYALACTKENLKVKLML